MLGRVADVAEEAVAPLVERVAEPGPARDRLEGQAGRVEAEVAAEDVDPRGPLGGGRAHLAAVARPGAVDPVVGSPLEVVHHGLDVVLAEPGEDPGVDVGLAVAVGVLEVPDVGRGRDEDAPLPGDDAGRPGELLGEDHPLVEDAVAVAVGQEADAAHGRIAEVLGERPVVLLVDVRVVAHLDDEEPAVLVVGRGHRVHDQGFGGQQVEPEPVPDAERRERLGRLLRREPRERVIGPGGGEHEHEHEQGGRPGSRRFTSGSPSRRGKEALVVVAGVGPGVGADPWGRSRDDDRDRGPRARPRSEQLTGSRVGNGDPSPIPTSRRSPRPHAPRGPGPATTTVAASRFVPSGTWRFHPGGVILLGFKKCNLGRAQLRREIVGRRGPSSTHDARPAPARRVSGGDETASPFSQS